MTVDRMWFQGSRIAADNLWISLSKQSGQSRTELNSIRLAASLLQFSQLVLIAQICHW